MARKKKSAALQAAGPVPAAEAIPPPTPEPEPEPPPPPVPARTQAVLAAALALATIAVFFQVHAFEFVNFDDPGYVFENPKVSGGLTIDGLLWAFTSVSHYYWQPLTWISHMIDCQLFGLNPGPHHLMNVALHTASSVLLFLLFTRMTGAAWPSAALGFLFALHPLRVESVAWVAERKDVLSGLFWVLAMWAYWRYTVEPARRRWRYVMGATVLALMSKPTVVTLPFAFLLMDIWPLGRLRLDAADWRARAWVLVREKLSLLVPVAAVSLLTFLGQQEMGATVSLTALPLYYRVNNAILSYFRYLGKTFWPVELGVFYPYSRVYASEVFAALTVLVVISALLARQVKRHPFAIVGWLWFLGVSLPTIGLAQAGMQSHADRFTYLPGIGLFITAAWGAAAIQREKGVPRPAMAAFAFAVCGALAALAYQQTRYWQDSLTLFYRTLAVTRDNDTMHINIAAVHMKRGETDKAVRHYQAVLKIEPGNLGARNLLAQAYMQDRLWLEALEQFNEILRRKPDHVGALRGTAIVYLRTGQLDEARRQLQEVLAVAPDDPEAKSLRAMLELAR